MQLTSTKESAASQRTSHRPFLEQLDYPVATGLIAFIAWLTFVLARWQTWAAGKIGLFVMAGHNYSRNADLPHVQDKGYDGQFYYRLALDPFNWSRTAYGITMDYNYRYTRIGFPVVAWIVSLGQHHLVPVALVVVNLICVAIMGWLGGQFARESGRHALWGLLFVAYFGLVISIGRDTAEPLADACMLGGLLAYRHSRYLLAAVLIAYGVITNEPILVLAIAIALTRLYQMYRRQARPGKQDLVWVLPGAAYVVLQGIEHVVVKGKAGGVTDLTQNFTFPFKAMVPAVVRDFRVLSLTHLTRDYNAFDFIVLAAVVVAGLLVLWSTTAPLHERVAFAGFVFVEMVIASGQFWDSTFGYGRTFIEAFLLGVIMLLATPARVTATADGGGRFTVFAANRAITNRQLTWLTVLIAVALVAVAQRLILSQ